jgi:hypothetical protein
VAKRLLFLFLLLLVFSGARLRAQTAAPDPVKKLGALLGKWESEGTFANGSKVTSSIDCSWSALGDYLICEQRVKLGDEEHRQLTVYSYSAADKVYFASTFPDVGKHPSTSSMEIDGNKWTYSGASEINGKRRLFRTVNEFSGRTETFRAEFSENGGVTWAPVMSGTAHKVGD